MEEDDTNDIVKKAKDNPLFEILRWQPNEEMTAYEVRFWMMVDCLIRGNGYAQVVRKGNGEIDSIWPLEARKVQMHRAPDDQRLIYAYYPNAIPTQRNDEPGAFFEKDEILHYKCFTHGGLVGLSLLHLQKEVLGSHKASENYSSDFFKNGIVPSGLVTVPEELSEDAYKRLQKDWGRFHSGKGNRFKVPILEGGSTFNPLELNNDEAQLIETRKFSSSTICGFFRVPAHLANDLTRSTFNNIEHQDLGFVKHSLRPWMTLIEQRDRMTLLPKESRNNFYFKHDTNDLLRGDKKSRFESYSQGIQNGHMSPNDARREEGENPYEGGDTYFANSTLKPVDKLGQDDSSLPPILTTNTEDE